MTAAYAAFANGGMVQAPILVRRVETTEGEVLFNGGTGAAACRQRGNRVPHVEHDGGRHQCGHRSGRAQRRVPSAGRRKDRDDQRLPRCVVRRLHSSSWRRASGLVTTSRERSLVADTRPCWRCPCGDVSWRRRRARIAPSGSARPPTVTSATICRLSGKLATDSCHENVTEASGATTIDVHGLHRVFRHGHRADRVVPDPPADPHVAVQSAGCADLAVASPRRRTESAAPQPPARVAEATPAPQPPPLAAARTAEEARVLVEGLRRRQQEVTWDSHRVQFRLRPSPPAGVAVACASRATRCRLPSAGRSVRRREASRRDGDRPCGELSRASLDELSSSATPAANVRRAAGSSAACIPT